MSEIKAKQILEELKEAGFYETRIIGDHHRLKDDKEHYVTINYSRPGDTMKQGTVASIRRQAGLK
ncbi:type II toxin-antitoxin system HicA family toxin [Pediococcus stilesii]|uniref:type II toxin-antitoxin system HicA family toxin n=1 Tax=Pediococcus stilesii TaxID=331679 RepID=UPI000709D3FF|nr:type II toxin-antitoxin system HicA family toxin [Pediococcus stilesii]